jgi:hypothetical protein
VAAEGLPQHPGEPRRGPTSGGLAPVPRSFETRYDAVRPEPSWLARPVGVAAPAGAITDGARDTVHTNVGLVHFTTTDGRFRCSGTLISQTVILTAGHGTEGPATDVLVSFDTDLALDPACAGNHARGKGESPGPTTSRARLILIRAGRASSATRSSTTRASWCSPRRPPPSRPDVEPAQLPPVGCLNRNKGKLKNETFTLVGYGSTSATRRRRSLQNVGREVVTFQINDRDSKAGRTPGTSSTSSCRRQPQDRCIEKPPQLAGAFSGRPRQASPYARGSVARAISCSSECLRTTWKRSLSNTTSSTSGST